MVVVWMLILTYGDYHLDTSGSKALCVRPSRVSMFDYLKRHSLDYTHPVKRVL